MRNSKLNGWEVLAIIVIWVVVLTLVYLSIPNDWWLIAIVAIASGYYLTKWIILKRDPDVEPLKSDKDEEDE